MAKFKVGDRVKLINQEYISPYLGIEIGFLGTVINVSMNGGYDVKFDNYGYSLFFLEQNLELVEPEKEETKYIKYYVRGLPREIPVKLSDLPYLTDEKGFIKYPKIEITKKLESVKIDRFKKAFVRKPFPYYHFSLNDDALDAIQYASPPNLDYQRHILGIRTKPQPPKNRIPDRVVFNEDKGKVTVLISKMNDGEAPYRAYTSKVNVDGGDKYDAQFGFLLSYYKYLTRMYTPQKQKELIERIFNLLPTKRYPYLLGAVETEVLKISDVVKSYKDWEELYVAITEPTLKKNGTWDYLEWKEMLRVHELETKREKQREVQKEIKKHQKEIDRLKKEV